MEFSICSKLWDWEIKSMNRVVRWFVYRRINKKTIFCVLLLLCIFRIDLILAENAKNNMMISNLDAGEYLNLHIAPDIGSRSLGEYYNGVAVSIIEYISDTWAKVKVGTVEGYMMSEYLGFGGEEVESVIPRYMSISSGWEVYDLPSRGSNIRMYGYGEEVLLLGFSEEWWHIQIGNTSGFVSAGAACLEAKEANYYDGYSTAVVNNPNPTDRLHLREEASSKSRSLGKYYNGCIVAILAETPEGWYRVRIGNSEGYMLGDYLEFGISKKSVLSTMPVLTIKNTNALGANLREKASTDSKNYGLYPNGTRVQVMGMTKNWCHVRVEGEIGFMMTKLLDPQLSYSSTDVDTAGNK